MPIFFYPVFVLIVGLIIYAVAPSARAQELGKWMFIVGLVFSVALFLRAPLGIR